MNIGKSGIAVFLLVLLAALISLADDKNTIIDQQKELEQIKNDVAQGQKRLDSLRNLQSSIQNQLSDVDQKLTSDRKLISRLNRQMTGLNKDINDADDQLQLRRDHRERTLRRYLGSLRQFYLTTRRQTGLFSEDPNEQLQRHREIKYLTSLASFESGTVAQAREYLTASQAELDGLTGRQKEVSGLKKKHEVSYSLDQSRKSQREKDLDQVKRRSNDEAERVMTLQMAAAEMERIITRLQEEQTKAQLDANGQSRSSIFTTLKGQLSPPVRGKITTAFGPSEHPVTKLKSFSPGITIKARVNTAVYSVASGKVAYSGDLRGYGKFVIISHDNVYYTTYAGLGKIHVTEGQFIATGTRLGDSGDDGVVKFEIRKGREPLDPVTWIKFEAF